MPPGPISGGDGNDKLDGDGGDDRLVGDRGTDRRSARRRRRRRAGLEQRRRQSDVADGDAGADASRSTAPRRPATSSLPPERRPCAFARTNLVPFTVDFAAEALAVNDGGGDDRCTVSPGLPGLLVTADGGSGNDSLSGADGG